MVQFQSEASLKSTFFAVSHQRVKVSFKYSIQFPADNGMIELRIIVNFGYLPRRGVAT